MRRWHIQFVAAATCWLAILQFPAAGLGLFLAGLCNALLGYDNFKRGI